MYGFRPRPYWVHRVRRWAGTLNTAVVGADKPLLPEMQVLVNYAGSTRTLNGPSAQSYADQLRHSSGQPGGFEACTFRIPYSEFYAQSSTYSYGATVTVSIATTSGGVAQDDGGTIVWQGYLRNVTPNDDVSGSGSTWTGTAVVECAGWQHVWREHDWPIFLQTRDDGDYTTTDAGPFVQGYANPDSIDVRVKEGTTAFIVPRGSEITAGDIGRMGLWTEDGSQVIKRVAGTARANRAVPGGSSSPNYKLRIERNSGPATNPNQGYTVSTITPPTTAAGTSSIDVTLGNPEPLVTVGLVRTGASTAQTGEPYKVTIPDLRFNGTITQADSYTGSDLITWMAGRLGFNTNQVTASTTNILPYWHKGGSWWDVAAMWADLHARKFGVWELAQGVEWRAWGTGTTWQVYCYGSSSHAVADIRPSDDIYSEVDVRYRRAGSGALKHSRAYVSPNPFAALTSPVRRRVYVVDLPDPQGDSTLADSIASTLATEFSTERYAGTIRLSYTFDGANDRTAVLCRAGEQVTIPDFPGGSRTLRIYAADHDEQGTTLSVGRPPQTLGRLMWAITHGPKARKRRFGL